MKFSDKELGMDKSISRRDFLNGVAAVTAVAAMPNSSLARDIAVEGQTTFGYPPARTGPRGSHPGSYEVAHELVWNGRKDWGAFVMLNQMFTI